MSSRPTGRTAFEGLRPTIIREPKRSLVDAEAEGRLLETSMPAQPLPLEPEGKEPIQEGSASARQEADIFHSRKLLTKKKRDVLIPVTFRMPQSLKERLEKTAKARELNQTDLINEAIELNLSRYV